MPTGTFNLGGSIGGISFNKSISKTNEHPNPYEVPLPVATTVDTWVKTDADTGTATLVGHSLTNGTYDAYWDGGVRYGCTGVFTDDDLLLDVTGYGDDFPANGTPMTVCKQVEINTQIDGDTANMMLVLAEYANLSETSHCHADFQDVGSASIMALDLIANEPSLWWEDNGSANPMTGNPITDCFASNGSADNVATLKIVTLEDATP